MSVTSSEPAPSDRTDVVSPQATSVSKAGGRLRDWLLTAAPGLVAFIALSPAVFERYGYIDDFALLYHTKVDPSEMVDGWLAAGRPVSALLEHVVYICAGTIDAFGVVRFVGAAGVALCVLQVSRVLKVVGFRAELAFLGAVSLAFLPSMVVCVTWGGLFVACWAMVLSLQAGYQLLLAGGGMGRGTIAAWALLAVAATTYQTGAMAFWLVWLAWVLSPNWSEIEWRTVARMSFSFLLAMTVCCAVALVVQKAGARFTHMGPSRAALTTDVLGKLSYVRQHVWPRIVDPWNKHPRLWLWWPLLGALGLATRASVSRRAFRILAVAAVVILGYTPSLATSENWAAARTMLALMPILPLSAISIVGDLCDRLGVAGTSFPLRAGAGVAAALGVAFTATFIESWVVVPSQRELAVARQVILSATEAPSLTVLPSFPSESFAPGIDHDEFGFPFTARGTGLIPLTELIYREQHGTWYGHVHYRERDDVSPITDAAVLDFAAVLDPDKRPDQNDRPHE